MDCEKKYQVTYVKRDGTLSVYNIKPSYKHKKKVYSDDEIKFIKSIYVKHGKYAPTCRELKDYGYEISVFKLKKLL